MISIYIENEQIDFWIQQSNIDSSLYQIVNDYTLWISQPNRIAAVEVLEFSHQTCQSVQKLVADADLVLVFVPELINTEWLWQFDHSNVVFFTAGILNNCVTLGEITSTDHEFVQKRRARFIERYNAVKADHWPAVDDFLNQKHIGVDMVSDVVNCCNGFQDYDNILADIWNTTEYSRFPKHAQLKMHNYFFWSTVDFYRTCTDVLGQVATELPRPYCFDVLLGRQKYHRDLINNSIDRNCNIVTYFGCDHIENLATAEHYQFQWPVSVISPDECTVGDTTDIVVVDGTIVSLSQIIPVDIYNQTAYTLVCESQCDNSYSFFTEKTIKPMLAGRPFLVCSGQYFLQNLRRLGFKTFDGVFDESYDLEWSLERRVDMIVAEMNRVQQLDQQWVYDQLQAVLEHNRRLLFEHDWAHEMFDAIKTEIDVFLNSPSKS